MSSHLPYQYSRVITERAPRYYRLPTIDEEKEARLAMDKKGPAPEVVSSLMEGDYFLALADQETREGDGAAFYRTVRGRYVRESDVELRNPKVVRGATAAGACLWRSSTTRTVISGISIAKSLGSPERRKSTPDSWYTYGHCLHHSSG